MSDYLNAEIERLKSVLESECATALGEPTDFDGYSRVLFSLDNPYYSIVEGDTLPTLIELMQKVTKVKLDIRLCAGGYLYDRGVYRDEVSFLIRVEEPAAAFLKSLVAYLRHYTKQESFLWISKEGTVVQQYLDEIRGTKNLGLWKEVSSEVAQSSFGYTKIANRWFVAQLVGVEEKEISIDIPDQRLTDHVLKEKMDEKLPCDCSA